MVSVNVTVDPAAWATAVEHPEITEIRNTRSGLIRDAKQYINSQRYDRLIRIRNRIRDSIYRADPRLVCAICGVPVYIVSSLKKSFFFRHTVEDGSCPAQTRGAWSFEQIKAMKYHGAQESDAHRRMKALLERSLRADPRASEIYQERTWRSAGRPASYRRPDVQALYGGVRLAFEAQLSTTFLDVVVGRRAFSRDDGALLFWVLPRFDARYRQLTIDDILFTNNHNIFVVNEQTVKLSEENHRCTFRCYYREPHLEGDVIVEKWADRLVSLPDLTFDLSGQQAFWFDFDRTTLRVSKDLAEQKACRADELRADVFAFWERNGGWEKCDADEDDQWHQLRHRLIMIGVDAPIYHKTAEFRAAVSGIISAKLGRPVGSEFVKLVQVAHNLADRHRGTLRVFGWAVRVYGAKAVIDREDTSGRWRTKATRIRAAMKRGDPAYAPDTAWGEALRFLFPELTDRIPPNEGNTRSDTLGL